MFSLSSSHGGTQAYYETVAEQYQQRLLNLFTIAPIPFRPQNGGHYDEADQLKPGLEGNSAGLSIHQIPSIAASKKARKAVA